VIDSGVPCYMYGLDVFMEVAIPEDHANRLAQHDDSGVALAGRLLSHRISFSADEEARYSGLIGDAGAVCALIDPDALTVEHLPVRVELTGYGRGQTIVDRRARGGEDLIHGSPAGWTPMDVALRVDADRLGRVFLEAIRAGSPVTEGPVP
jgi:inosine-uridine nucleoside N-ribohydrolase